MSEVTLRLRRSSDADDITTILNHYVAHTTSTFLTGPVTVEDRRQWIDRWLDVIYLQRHLTPLP